MNNSAHLVHNPTPQITVEEARAIQPGTVLECVWLNDDGDDTDIAVGEQYTVVRTVHNSWGLTVELEGYEDPFWIDLFRVAGTNHATEIMHLFGVR